MSFKIPINNSPIRKNLLANLFGVGVQLMNQIVLVPFYILFWGNELYSDWIVISALTTIFSMSDVGLNNVIQNRFAIKLSEGKKKECESLLTNNYILVAITLLFTLLICFAFVLLFDISDLLNLHLLSRKDASLVLAILIVKVFLGMLSNVEDSIYRATHVASISIYMNQIGNFLVAIITLMCIISKLSVILLSVLICLPYLFLTIIKYFHSKKYFIYYFRFKTADWQLFKEVLMPSLSFMSFPLGNMVVLQGYTLVVNSFFGAESVVLYNTTRTLCNFVKTLLNTLQYSVWPEYSIAYGNKDYHLMRHLHRKVINVTLTVSLIASIGILIFGPLIFKIWTHGAVEYNYHLMLTYISAILMESLWVSSSVTMMATNHHTKVGILYLCATLVAITIAIIMLLLIENCSLAMITITLVIMHLVLATYVIRAGLKFTDDSIAFSKFFRIWK